jgi:signal transduction histidine kinase
MTAVDPGLRVLVLAPFGRDGALTCDVLRHESMDCLCCENVVQLCDALRAGAGAAVVAAEALHQEAIQALITTLAEQPPWSDLPVVVATTSTQSRATREALVRALAPSAHITLLERPIRVTTLVSLVRSAISTRRRQYQLRDLIEELRLSVEHLDAEQEVRQRFIDLLAHDLRGLLSVARMGAQLIGAVRDDERQAELARRMQRSLEQADKMIRNLLDAHRLRAGHRLSVHAERCDLVAIAHETADDLAEAERRRLVVNTPAELHGYWDRDLLRRALWNLVTNAVKYGANETPVTVEVGRDDGTVWIRVHNWGPPIPAEEHAQLFQPFMRARHQESGGQRGWGLGLTLVHGVAEAHGGAVAVESSAAAGTTFTLQLPDREVRR